MGFLGRNVGHRMDDILELPMRARPVGLKTAASLLVKPHTNDPAPWSVVA